VECNIELPLSWFASCTKYYGDEVFSSCLAIVSAVMVGGLFLWPALRYGTGYQTVWEIRPSAETHSSVHWRRF